MAFQEQAKALFHYGPLKVGQQQEEKNQLSSRLHQRANSSRGSQERSTNVALQAMGGDDHPAPIKKIGGTERVKHSLNAIWQEFKLSQDLCKRLQQEVNELTRSDQEQKKLILQLRQRIEELEAE